MEKSRGLELAEAVTDYVNNFNYATGIEEFCDGMNRQYRTLQQSFMRLIIGWLESNKKNLESGYYDDRNKRTVELSAKIIEIIDTYLPTI